MQVRHGFTTVWAVVNHHAIAGGEIELAGEGRGGEQEVAKHGLIGGRRGANARNGLFWNDEHVHGSLWLDIVDGDAELVFVDDLSRDFASDDFFEEGHANEG